MMPSTSAERRKLAERMEERRTELRLRWQDVAEAGNVSLRAIQSARTGDAEIRPLTQRGIEDGLKWPAGYIQALLDGKEADLDGDVAQQPPAAEPEPAGLDGEIRLPPAVAAQMSDTALRSILPQIVAQVDSALARNPKAAGRDIFPESAEVADAWDRFAPYPRPRRTIFAALVRLEEMRREWQEGLSG